MKIAITGGSGLIGSEISRQLIKKGHQIVHLSRNPTNNEADIQEFPWDPDKEEIDVRALKSCHAIINLAGTSINRRWTPENKNAILRSRIDSTRLLFDTVQKNNIPLKVIVSASAINYYPDSYQKTYSEKDPPGSDFLSTVCQKWEQEAQNFEKLEIRTIRFRIGLVLSKKGGVLPKMISPFKMGIGAALGTGEQWMSWIHLEDLAAMFVMALENQSMQGAYNACGPYSVTNNEFSETLADVLHKPFFVPKIPGFVLKLAMGESAELVLSSVKGSSSRIESSGFTFRYPTLRKALEKEL